MNQKSGKKRPWLAVAATLALLARPDLATAQDPAQPPPHASAEERIFALVRQGMALDEEGRYAEAVPLLQEAHAVLAQHAAVENRWRLNAAISLAHALSRLDRERDAAAVLEAENAAIIAAGQDAAPDAATVAYALAMILYNDNRYTEAGPPAQRACELYELQGADPDRCARLNHVRAAAGLHVEGLTNEERAEAQAARDMEAFTSAVGRGDDVAADAAFGGLLRWVEADDGSESRTVIALKLLRARVWRGSGRIEEARDELARLHAASRTAFGPADPDTLEALRYYAETLMQAGEAGQAEAVLTENIPAVTAQWGARSLETTRLLTARADVLSGSGLYAEADAAYRVAQEAAADLPEEDEDRVMVTASRASTLMMAGRFADARVILDPLDARLRTLGAETTPAGRQVQLALAEARLIDGDYAAAEAVLEPLLEAWPADGRRTMQARAAALADLAAVRRAQGRLVEGERMAAEAVTILETRAPMSLLRIRAQKIRGAILVGLGRYGDAGEVLRDTASLEARVMGEGHPETATTLMHLAEAQYEQGAVEAGRATMTRALDIALSRLGPDHAATAGIYNEAALLEWKADDIAAAAAMIAPAVAGYTAALGPENPQTLLARVNRAAIWAALGRRDEAIAEYQTLVDLRRRVLGDDHPDVASLLHTAAMQLEPDNAEEMLRRAVEIGQARLEPGDPDRMLWETGLAWILLQRGRPAQALPLLRGVGDQAMGRPGGLDVQHVGMTEAGRLRDMYRGQVIALWRVAHPAGTTP